MLLQTVITITDGYFTGNYVGQNALAAINLGLPILYFYLGTGLCIGVGGSVISGRMLGANERKKSSRVFSQTVVAALITCVAISVIVFLLFTPILKILRADGDLSVYFTEYYRIMLFTYPLMVIGTILGMFIRVDGKPQICMLVSIAGCIEWSSRFLFCGYYEIWNSGKCCSIINGTAIDCIGSDVLLH